MPKPRSRRNRQRPRGSKAADVLRLLILLRSGRWRSVDLAGELGCHARTIYRLLHALEAAGVRLEVHDEGAERYYRVRRDDLRRLLRI